MQVIDWLGAALGAVGYVGAYVAFQKWRTKGKWLDEVLEKIRG